MKNQTSIEVTLGADGTVKVEAIGYKGNSCEQATAFIEQALGMDGATRKRKPEYFSTNKTGAKQNVGG